MSQVNIYTQRQYYKFSLFLQAFVGLSVHVQKEEVAPHKPILLLAIINLVEKGKIKDNRIEPEDFLKEEFEAVWREFVPATSQYSPAVWTPFWHMKNEPFWFFKPVTSQSAIDSIVPAGQTASIGKIKEVVQFAYLDTELFDLMQKPFFRGVLKEALIDTYLR